MGGPDLFTGVLLLRKVPSLDLTFSKGSLIVKPNIFRVPEHETVTLSIFLPGLKNVDGDGHLTNYEKFTKM